jgi:hypothetical protein
MGLITGLLLLPLAPVRGTIWIAEQLVEEAERQLDPAERLRVELSALQVSYDLGELTEEEFLTAEDELMAWFAPGPDEAAWPPMEEVTDGDIDDAGHAPEAGRGS